MVQEEQNGNNCRIRCEFKFKLRDIDSGKDTPLIPVLANAI